MGDGWVAEKEVKAAIKATGGSVNQSGLFLSTTSNDNVVTKKSSVNRRSVAFIPRNKISNELLVLLDKGLIVIMCIKVPYVYC